MTASAYARYAPFVSEQLAAAVRADDPDGFASITPYAACMLPLLEALGRRVPGRDLIESLPHFASELGLTDLRNMMVELGYDSDPHPGSLSNLDPTLLPCLFVTRSGQLYVVSDRQGRELHYFDAQTGCHETGTLSGRGTVYLFTDTNSGALSRPNEDWFRTLFGRFKSLLKHLLAMTLILNLTTVAVPLFIMVVYDRVIGSRSIDALPFLVSGITFVLAIELGMRLLRTRTLGLVAGRLDFLIGVETFRQLVHLPPLLTERSSVSAQLSTLKQFDSIRDFFTGPTAALLLETPFAIVFIALIAVLAGWMALIPVVMMVIYLVIALMWLPIMNRQVAAAGAERTARQQMFMETCAGLRELKALGGEAVWRLRFREVSARTLTALYKTAQSQAILDSVAYTVTTLAGVAVLGLGTLRVMDGTLSIGALIAVTALVWRVLGPVQGLFLAYVKFDAVAQGVRTLNQLMKLRTERTRSKSSLLAPEVRGRVQFDRVSFRYGATTDPVLMGVSFAIEPGEFVAVLGENGCGKSTVLKLVGGMYQPQAGSVQIGEVDTRQFNPMELRRLIAYVPQNPVLFHGTIAQNLRMRNVMASDADLEQAAEQAGVLDGIVKLPKGFDSRIGDATTEQLPSGLVHGLCLARAFVSAAPIVLLDEPGAGLDRDGDATLMTQLERLKGKKTVLMVSHRPSHIRLADKTILLTRGVIQYVGPPDEAIAMIYGG